MDVETQPAEASGPPSRPTRSAEARTSDGDASIDDEQPLPRKDDYKAYAEEVERTLNGRREEAEKFFRQSWTGCSVPELGVEL
ncbi:hypothetical protein [Actinocrispum sp. NPDC049592]|uniref:hypothetical protein n=1 Tax=Actinocrispum sp. NPDC049592 TaxID=3154835 RepID=UPI003428127C